jgi:hypothetical protein
MYPFQEFFVFWKLVPNLANIEDCKLYSKALPTKIFLTQLMTWRYRYFEILSINIP